VARPQHFGEEPFGNLGVSVLTEQELQGIALGLIYPAGSVGLLQMGLAALL
jgi:hypothetical protein